MQNYAILRETQPSVDFGTGRWSCTMSRDSMSRESIVPEVITVMCHMSQRECWQVCKWVSWSGQVISKSDEQLNMASTAVMSADRVTHDGYNENNFQPICVFPSINRMNG